MNQSQKETWNDSPGLLVLALPAIAGIIVVAVHLAEESDLSARGLFEGSE